MNSASRIGRGTVIRGSVRGDGEIEIEGRIEGVIDVDGDLTLTDSARVRVEDGALTGRRIAIRGAVAGNIRGTAAIVLEEGARVVGDLSAPSIGIRPGGLLRGHVATGDGTPSEVPTRGRAERAVTARVVNHRAAPKVAAPPPRAAAKPAARSVTQRISAADVASDAVPTPNLATPRGKAAARLREAPAPVMPSLKKGQKGQMKRRAGK